MSLAYEFPKDPDEALDYGLDWTDNMVAGDTITNVQWFIPAGLTQGSSAFTNNITSIFLSGGTENQVYAIRCRITTSQGRVLERTVRLRVRSR